MSVPPVLNVYPHDADNRALVTLTGEIDLSSAPLVHASLERCLHDGIRAIGVEVTDVTFCDRGGLNAFLYALPHTTAAGGALQLHHPSAAMERLVALTGSLFLALPDAFAGSRPSPRPSPVHQTAHRLAPASAALPGGVARADPIAQRPRPSAAHLAHGTWRSAFAMLTAEASSSVGYASGFPVGGDGSWWTGFDGALPLAVDRLAGSDRALAFTGVLVHPQVRNRDVARRPQERLLAEHQASLGATSADRADQPVLAAFRSWGRKDVGDVRRAADGAVFLSLVLFPGVRTAARPEGFDHHSWSGWSP